jgi:hypothetical protein
VSPRVREGANTAARGLPQLPPSVQHRPRGGRRQRPARHAPPSLRGALSYSPRRICTVPGSSPNGSSRRSQGCSISRRGFGACESRRGRVRAFGKYRTIRTHCAFQLGGPPREGFR